MSVFLRNLFPWVIFRDFIFPALSSFLGFSPDKDTKNGRLGIGKFLEYEDSRIEVPDGSYLYVGEKRISMDDISGDGLTWFIKQENGIVYLGSYDEWVSAGKPSMI